MKSLDLIAHPSFPAPPYSVRAKVEAKNYDLAIEYEVAGEIEEIVFPDVSLQPSRKTGLWESTCFELFVRPQNTTRYWEGNFSPSGDWNLFQFSSYREGMTEPPFAEALRVQTKKSTRDFRLQTRIPFKKLNGVETKAVELGITAVIQTKTLHTHYWALTHHSHQPDFHDPKTFSIHLNLVSGALKKRD